MFGLSSNLSSSIQIWFMLWKFSTATFWNKFASCLIFSIFHFDAFYWFQIDCCCKLSGMPDLTMSLVNPRLLDDLSFHPCVRFKRWEVSIKVLLHRSFITRLQFYKAVFHIQPAIADLDLSAIVGCIYVISLTFTKSSCLCGAEFTYFFFTF